MSKVSIYMRGMFIKDFCSRLCFEKEIMANSENGLSMALKKTT